MTIKQFECPTCGKWFQYNSRTIVSCLVAHGGGCCHYGQKEIACPMAPLGDTGFPEVPPMPTWTIRCGRAGCAARVAVEMTELQAKTYSDAIVCGSRGDGWDLYRELQDELKVRCHLHEGQ